MKNALIVISVLLVIYLVFFRKRTVTVAVTEKKEPEKLDQQYETTPVKPFENMTPRPRIRPVPHPIINPVIANGSAPMPPAES